MVCRMSVLRCAVQYSVVLYSLRQCSKIASKCTQRSHELMMYSINNWPFFDNWKSLDTEHTALDCIRYNVVSPLLILYYCMNGLVLFMQ